MTYGQAPVLILIVSNLFAKAYTCYRQLESKNTQKRVYTVLRVGVENKQIFQRMLHTEL